MKRSAFALALAVAVLATTPAHASIWDRAEDGLTPELAAQIRDRRPDVAHQPKTEYVPAPIVVEHEALFVANANGFSRHATTANGVTTVYHFICVDFARGATPPVTADECVQPFATIDHATATAADWRPLLDIYFRPHLVDLMQDIMDCESGGDPYAQNTKSTAGGLFQFLDGTWRATGFGQWSKYDPEANIAAAASWVDEGGGSLRWIDSQWVCYGLVT